MLRFCTSFHGDETHVQAFTSAKSVCFLLFPQDGGSFEWLPPSDYELHHPRLAGEVQVGGVYLRAFLQAPTSHLSDAKRFADALLQHYLSSLAAATAAAAPRVSEGGGAGTPPGSPPAAAAAAAVEAAHAPLLAAAATALLSANPLLSEHVAALGYIPKLLASLGRLVKAADNAASASGTDKASSSGGDDAAPAAAAPPPQAIQDLAAGALRLLHQLAAQPAAAEAVALSSSPPLVTQLLTLLSWSALSGVLVLETLKRLLAVNNRRRDSLVAACLAAAMIPSLLGSLDWSAKSAATSTPPAVAGDPPAYGSEAAALALPAAISAEHHAAVLRALAADVLRALAADGAHAAQVRFLLN